MEAGKPTPTSADVGVPPGPARSAREVANTLGIGSATVDRVRAIDRGPEEIKERVAAIPR